jgi:aspartyl-tRNA(Asn)/glutamyl-tRNA(Gln) amidotransferase subunit B
MKEYKLTVGLEVHAELSTKTKMFCDCINNPEEEKPNLNVCPVCMGYPGTLPVINKEAVRQVLRFGAAVNGNIADYTEFDRKNYFYPDIPKGYQISQYKYPLIKGGELAGIAITRVHLEEDTAKSTHDKNKGSLVDYNRAGVPLMELVTEPVIHSAEEAANFAKELQLLLWYLGASEANMEKGEMRVEANISVSSDENLGTKVEVKNLNSFKAVEKAIKFEFNRHTEMLERGEKITQETRGWDENKEETFSQRAKEDSHDYRYFPDPDLPKLFISEIEDFNKEELENSLPELPEEKRKRLKTIFGIKDEDVEIYVRDAEWGRFFEETSKDATAKFSQLVSNYITSDLANLLKEKNSTPWDTNLTPGSMKELIEMTEEGMLSSRGTKDLLKELINTKKPPRTLADELGLLQKNDTDEIRKIVTEVINKNEKVVSEYKGGNENSLQYLIGQGMKESKGSANPQILKQIFIEELK